MVLTADHPVLARIRDSARLASNGGRHTVTFHAMATACKLSFAASTETARVIAESAVRRVADFEAKYSRFLPDSLISRINVAAGTDWTEIDPETERILALCQEAHFLTRGVFDPTALPLIQLWNWKQTPPIVPTAKAIDAARQKTGWRKVQRSPGRVRLPEPGMSLDLGGIGKEYAVDQVARLALGHGLPGILVDFGQDVFVYGQPPDGRPAWKIGLEDPERPGSCWTALAVQNCAVATSGDYARRFTIDGRRYGHIIDIRTGQPVNNGCRAVSVLAPSCTVAGMLSTAAFVLGPEEGLHLIESYFQAEGCLVFDDRKITTRRFYDHVIKEK